MVHRRRVVFFAAYPHVYGGVERGLQLLASGLAEREWSVEVVLPAEGVAAERFLAAGLSVDVVAESFTALPRMFMVSLHHQSG